MAMRLGQIGTDVGLLISNEWASEVPYAKWFGLLSINMVYV